VHRPFFVQSCAQRAASVFGSQVWKMKRGCTWMLSPPARPDSTSAMDCKKASDASQSAPQPDAVSCQISTVASALRGSRLLKSIETLTPSPPRSAALAMFVWSHCAAHATRRSQRGRVVGGSAQLQCWPRRAAVTCQAHLHMVA
jgi:hypothetical protein